MQYDKIKNPISIPLELDLLKFMDQTKEKETSSYKLNSICFHHGNTIRQGHYTCKNII